MAKNTKKPNNSKKICVQTYVSDVTYDRWKKHYEKMKPQYHSISHMLEVAGDWNIESDNYEPNKWVGKTGPMKLVK